MAVTALAALAKDGEIKQEQVLEAMRKYGIDQQTEPGAEPETAMSEQEIKVPISAVLMKSRSSKSSSVGDSVEEEDPILTVESDKARRTPAPVAGKISKITVKVGDKVKEGDVIGMLAASGDAGARRAADDKSEQTEEKSEAPLRPDRKTPSRLRKRRSLVACTEVASAVAGWL